ncbi:hypothetical protein UPYG_G00209810 [Umbra pygmaea]|uniref:Uncharacterized protein n=1 Tax=Umbra pygmaea TaxID=75934 RepID=A0ABD0X1L1_UMBPY
MSEISKERAAGGPTETPGEREERDRERERAQWNVSDFHCFNENTQQDGTYRHNSGGIHSEIVRGKGSLALHSLFFPTSISSLNPTP